MWCAVGVAKPKTVQCMLNKPSGSSIMHNPVLLPLPCAVLQILSAVFVVVKTYLINAF